MAVITATSIKARGQIAVTETTLGASDTFTFNRGAILILTNDSGGALTPNITGDGGTTVSQEGLGIVTTSAGYTFSSVANLAVACVRLDTISEYLKGTITVTGGDGMVATLLEL